MQYKYLNSHPGPWHGIGWLIYLYLRLVSGIIGMAYFKFTLYLLWSWIQQSGQGISLLFIWNSRYDINIHRGNEYAQSLYKCFHTNSTFENNVVPGGMTTSSADSSSSSLLLSSVIISTSAPAIFLSGSLATMTKVLPLYCCCIPWIESVKSRNRGTLIDWIVDCLIAWLLDDCLIAWLLDYWLIDWLKQKLLYFLLYWFACLLAC